MKSKYLFPTWGSWVGYVLAIPGFVLGYFNIIQQYEIPGFGLRLRKTNGIFTPAFENFTNELAILLVIAGLLLIAFSKSRKEDELNARLRLNALYWGVMTYYLFYFVGLVFSMSIAEIPFIGDHASELNLFTPLVIFIGRFYYLKYFKKESYLISEPRFLPHLPFKPVGVVLSLVCLVLTFVFFFSLDDEKWDPVKQVNYLGLVIGLLLWAFSQHKKEDEMLMQQRLESLQLAVYINYGLLLVANVLLYSFSFLYFMLFAQFSLLLYFVLRMEYVNYKNNRLLTAAEGGMSYEK